MEKSNDDLLVDTDTPGAVLRKARIKAGLTQKQVAEKLFLLPQQVLALEEDRYDTFSAPVFARGHLSSYAKLMDVADPDIKQRYQRLSSRVECDEVVVDTANNPCVINHVKHTRAWHLGWVAIVAVAVLLWWQHDNGVDVTPLSHMTVDNVVVDKSDHNIVAALEGPVNAPAAGAAVFAIDESMIDEPVSEEPDLIEASEKDLLSFTFAGDCWVEVKDSEDRVLSVGLKRAEEKLKVNGRAPFRVLLGYAPVVELNYNGEPVDISVNRTNNSARLLVGSS